MKLHIIRHAEPATSSNTGKDIDRTLTATGIEEARVLAEYLSERVSGCEVWCSGAVRTRETLDTLQKTISFGDCIYYPDFHLCPQSTYLHYLWQSETEDDLVIIGHNFGISDLVGYFTDEEMILQTAEYICIEFENLKRNELSTGTGTIVNRFHPELR